MNLVNIYADATNDPFSYLLIDMTQEGKAEVKYLSHLFEKIYLKFFCESLKLIVINLSNYLIFPFF